MMGTPRPIALLDASVLYPALLRNILMYLALRDLFRAHWSERIHDEWTRSLMRDRPDIPAAAIERTRRLMDQNIEGAIVSNYEHRVEAITLPDIDDRHVLAAATECEATIIVTANLRDFPSERLSAYGIEAQNADSFILGLFKDSPNDVISALHELRQDLKNPPMTATALLATMARHGLVASAEALAAFGDLI
jgi:predicted nucleic acid-binding protein